MKRTGYLHDNRYLLHDTGPYHPEMADRLTAVYNGIKDAGLLEHLTLIPAVRADLKWIRTVHDSNYIRRFEEVCLSGNRTFDYPDNQMCVDTYETAFLAVGCSWTPPGESWRANWTMHSAPSVLPATMPSGTRPWGSATSTMSPSPPATCSRRTASERVGIIDPTFITATAPSTFSKPTPRYSTTPFTSTPPSPFPGTGREFEEGEERGPRVYQKFGWSLPGQGDDIYKQLIESDLLPAFRAVQTGGNHRLHRFRRPPGRRHVGHHVSPPRAIPGSWKPS
jgi:hypothetical protein